MKRPSIILVACALALLSACATTGTTGAGPAPSAAQQAITSTTVSYNAVDAAIVAADAAVRAGTLKGQDARNAVKGLTDAKAGLDLALITLRAANAAAASTAASGAKP